MIIQALLDAFSHLVADLLTSIPALPSEWTEALGWLGDGGAWIGSKLGVFGVIIPWSVVGTCLTAWAGLVVFWGAVQVVRAIVWALGR